MDPVSIGISVVAFATAVTIRRSQVRALNELEQAKRKEKRAKQSEDEIKKTLVALCDESGNVRGQLALPGEVPADEAIKRLLSMQDDFKNLEADMSALHKKYTESHARERELETTLAQVVDKDNKVLVQLRLPGKQVDPPNRTPCGGLCVNGYWNKDRSSWRCRAYQGYAATDARQNFLDGDNQCVMFEKVKRKWDD